MKKLLLIVAAVFLFWFSKNYIYNEPAVEIKGENLTYYAYLGEACAKEKSPSDCLLNKIPFTDAERRELLSIFSETDQGLFVEGLYRFSSRFQIERPDIAVMLLHFIKNYNRDSRNMDVMAKLEEDIKTLKGDGSFGRQFEIYVSRSSTLTTNSIISDLATQLFSPLKYLSFDDIKKVNVTIEEQNTIR